MKLGPGLCFSWKRGLSVIEAKHSIAYATGIPTTRNARRNSFGCLVGIK